MQQNVQSTRKTLMYVLNGSVHINIAVESPRVSISGNLASVCMISSFGTGATLFWLEEPEEWTRSLQALEIAFV